MRPTVCFTSAALRQDVSMSIVREMLAACAEEFADVRLNVDQATIQVHVGTPHRMPAQRGQNSLFVFYTASEATRIPEQWVRVLNECTEVWTPSRFSHDAFVASGVTRPIRIVPHGITCPPAPTVRRSEGNCQPFTFMWQGAKLKSYHMGHPHDGDRKRGHLVERAFAAANLPNSRLILKYLPVEGVSYDVRVGPVWYICKSMSNTEVDQLDALTDAFVWPTMGEGFGMPPLEKLAKGIPAFATFWSGPLEYQQDFPLRRLLPTRLRDVRFNGTPTQMADIDLTDLVDLMTYCHDNQAQLSAIRPKLYSTAQRWDVAQVLTPSLRQAIHELSNPAATSTRP